MIIQTEFTQHDFINANIAILYSKLTTKVINYLSIFLFIMFLIAIIASPNQSYISLIIPIGMFTFSPLSVYFGSKRNFATDKMNRQLIEYHMTMESIHIKGESFTTNLSWNNIYKVTKKWGWILIWHNNQIANAIPKKLISSQQIIDLKNMLIANKVKNNI